MLASAQVRGGIKSIQRGTVSFTNSAAADASNTTVNAAIVSVNTAKTELRLLGSRGDGASPLCTDVTAVLANATTITLQRQNRDGVAVASWEATEFY